jgi:pimeloyl-ACP methyl ester carboxylesterase
MKYRLKSGATIAYAPGGSGDMTLVMLHPVGLRGAVWTKVADELADEYRTLAVDLPGHGESDVPPRRQSIEDMAVAVLELIATVGGERVVLIGCSMGSAVTAAAAASADKKIAGIVLSNSGGGRGPERHKSLTARADAARKGMAASLDTTMKRWFTHEVLATRADLTAPVTDWLMEGDPIVHAWGWEALREFDYTPLFAKLTLPALVIAGTLDQSASTAAVQAVASALPNAEYREIEGAGHLSPWERPRDYAALVREFVVKQQN